MRADERLAVALADAMLAGPWELAGLRARGRRVIGRTPAWLTALVSEVLTAYHRPPADRPRELAAFVLASAAMRKARRATAPLPKPVARPSSPTAMVSRPFPVPVIDHVGDLAERLGLSVEELDALADTRLRARRRARRRGSPITGIAGCPGRPVRGCWRHRSRGSPSCSAPSWMNCSPRSRCTPPPTGSSPGDRRSPAPQSMSARPIVIGLDLEHFFAAITAGRIWGVLRAAGYPEPVAHLLTGLTTHASPVSALNAMPAGRDAARDFRLRRRLAAPHLPQGAPTSPQLANLVCLLPGSSAGGLCDRRPAPGTPATPTI